MDKSKLYKGKLCGYCEVERLKDEKLLKACDKAASIISSHDWQNMKPREGSNALYAKLNVDRTEFYDCRVIIRYFDGQISSRLAIKISKESLLDDFRIDLYSHPKVGELD